MLPPRFGATRAADGAPMHVLHLTSEMAPYAATGGLAEVCALLPRALAGLGVQSTVVMPLYRCARENHPAIEDTGRRIRVSLGSDGQRDAVRVMRAVLNASVDVVFLDHPESFDRDGLYSGEAGDHADNDRRFALLCRAALAVPRALGIDAHIVHAHDWQTAPACWLLRSRFGAWLPSVLTVHNVAFQGLFQRGALDVYGIDQGAFNLEGVEFWGKFSALKAGLLTADKITTVSPTYAREIRTPTGGAGLHGLFDKRARDLVGILNGTDYDTWSPDTDPNLPERYSAGAMNGKRACKKAMCKRLGLHDPARPVFALLSRLIEQKGADLVLEVAHAIVDAGASLAVVGSGRPPIEDAFKRLAAELPGMVGVSIGHDLPLAHLTQGGADAVLVPYRNEPCGKTQLHGLRYGTIPIARRTGGLADTVVDADAEPPKGNGFVFAEPQARELLDACRRAIDAWRHPVRWKGITQRAMAADFSWDRAARAYAELYARLVDEHRGRPA